MAKKVKNPKIPIYDIEILEDDYIEKVGTDARFSIEVDPENKYHFSDTQKDFIANYVQFKNVPLAAKLSDIEEELAKSYYNNYNVKAEIRRINLAYQHRACATKMINMDELGGWLTSILFSENVVEADKIGTRDKLQVVKLIMEIQKMKQESIANPDNIIDGVIDIQEDLSKLSVDTIKNLLTTSKKPSEEVNEKNSVIEEINETNNNGLTTEEINHLKTLSTPELLNILEETNKNIQEREEANIFGSKRSQILDENTPSPLNERFKKIIDEGEEEIVEEEEKKDELSEN